MNETTKSSPERGLELFVRHLKKRNLSANTICVYRCSVEQFYRMYPKMTARNLQLYKVYLLEHYRPQTVNLQIRALNCFLLDKEIYSKRDKMRRVYIHPV